MSVAIITGASSGIGSELVKQLENYTKDVDEIWAIARRENLLEELKEKTTIPLRAVPLDLTDVSSLNTLEEMLKAEHKDVSVLINCAGYGKFGSYADIENSAALGMIDLNCRALVGVTNIVLPFMKRGAKILQICSISSFQPLPLMAVYAASKVFVLNYSRALWRELKPLGITVTALCPGWVDTAFFKTATDTKNPKAVTKYTFMQTPERVVKQGLKAMQKGRMLSIVGAQNKILYVLNKILPVKMVMNTWIKTQK
jgi:short-subunit dehydrogenase